MASITKNNGVRQIKLAAKISKTKMTAKMAASAKSGVVAGEKRRRRKRHSGSSGVTLRADCADVAAGDERFGADVRHRARRGVRGGGIKRSARHREESQPRLLKNARGPAGKAAAAIKPPLSTPACSSVLLHNV